MPVHDHFGFPAEACTERGCHEGSTKAWAGRPHGRSAGRSPCSACSGRWQPEGEVPHAITFSDRSDRIFCSPRETPFYEMEYVIQPHALREARTDRDARTGASSSPSRCARLLPMTSPFRPRPGVHRLRRYADDRPVLRVLPGGRGDHLRELDGRPHWGSCTAALPEQLAAALSQWGPVPKQCAVVLPGCSRTTISIGCWERSPNCPVAQLGGQPGVRRVPSRHPSDAHGRVDLVKDAAAAGSTVKVVGGGALIHHRVHDGHASRARPLRWALGVSGRRAGLVTRRWMTLGSLNEALDALGLGVREPRRHRLSDGLRCSLDRHARHGCEARAPVSMFVEAMELVTGDGSVLMCLLRTLRCSLFGLGASVSC